MVKSSKSKKAAGAVTDSKSWMRDSLIPKYFEPKVAAEAMINDTVNIDGAGQMYCVEISSSSSSAIANSKCVKYDTCKKKATGQCCRRMCFECCRAEANDSSCSIHYARQLKEDELDRDFTAVVADIQGFKSFVHTEERFTRVYQTVVIWCLKDFLRNKSWCDDVFEKHDRERRQKQLQLRRMYAFHTKGSVSTASSTTSRNSNNHDINTIASDEDSGSSIVSNNGATTICSDNSSSSGSSSRSRSSDDIINSIIKKRSNVVLTEKSSSILGNAKRKRSTKALEVSTSNIANTNGHSNMGTTNETAFNKDDKNMSTSQILQDNAILDSNHSDKASSHHNSNSSSSNTSNSNSNSV